MYHNAHGSAAEVYKVIRHSATVGWRQLGADTLAVHSSRPP